MELDNRYLVPPFRFSFVETDLYRGAYPVAANYNFLITLKLKSMISLIPEAMDNKLSDFLKEENIESYQYTVPKFVDQIIMSSNMITEILNIMCDKKNLPLYIHCHNGGHSTGLVIMCLRKLQMWSQRAMFSEFSRFINTFESCEEEFVNNYKATLELTSNRPSWLKHLAGKKTHPTLRVVLADEPDSEEDDLSKEDVDSNVI